MKERRKTLGPKFFLSVFAVLSLFISVLSTLNAYAAVPQNVTFSPTSGGTGTSVTITGKNFATPATVKFGGTSATNVTFISTTQILAVVGTGSTGKVSVTTSGGTGTSTADFTWKPSVTYNGNTNTGGMVPVDASSPYASGGTVTVLGNTGGLVKSSYIFSNWNTAADGTGTARAPGDHFTIGADTILYAQWTVAYSVTYNDNGSTGGSSPTEGSVYYASGATVTVLGNTGGLVRTGNTFAGWNTAADGTGTARAPGGTFIIGANTILYAQWTATVTYNDNGSTGGTVPVGGSNTYPNGATVTVLGNTGSLVKTGYTFAGWNTAANGLGPSYVFGDTFTIGTDTVLYAEWRASVTYDGNGSTSGTVPVDGHSPYLNGASVTVLGNTGSLVKTGGYVFKNWNTAADGTGTARAPGGTFAIGVNTILYAQWTTSYTVAYDGNGSTGGSIPADGSSPYASGATVTVLGNTGGLVRTGNTFAGWNTAADGTGTTRAPGGTFIIGANTILYAQWTATVTYNDNGSTGGSVPVDGSSPYASGATVTVLGNTGSLVKTGNTFANWNTAANGSGTSYAPTATFAIAANIVLYSQWTATVTYNANGATGGTAPVDGSSPYRSGGTVTVLGNTGSLVKTGYIFAHWNTVANGSGTSYSIGNTFNIGADTILYAQWGVVPPIATIETPVTQVVRADATGDTVVDATILGIGGIPFVVSVTIPAGAISRDITITIAPAATPAEISAGFIIIRVTASDSSGTSITQFDKPLIINLGHVNAGASVVFSQDEIAWTLIQLLSGTTLPNGMQEGYYVAVDGDIIILTRHLTYFGVKTPQVGLRVLSSANILKVGESATLTAVGGSGSGIIGYVTTTPSICSVSGAGLVRALTAGVCIVEATKSGAATYMNVLSLPLNLTIKRVLPAPKPSPTPGTTVNGGALSKTGSPWYNLLALSIGLILLGGVSLVRRKRRS